MDEVEVIVLLVVVGGTGGVVSWPPFDVLEIVG